jgi:hypothetical protein
MLFVFLPLLQIWTLNRAIAALNDVALAPL